MEEDRRKTIIEADKNELGTEEFGEFIKYTGTGFIGRLLPGAILDFF